MIIAQTAKKLPFLSQRFFSSFSNFNIIIGVNVILVDKSNRVLLGQRLNSIGAGTYGFPAGRLEKNESIVECAKRETKEETGIILTETKLLTHVTGVFSEIKRPFRSYFLLGKHFKGEPKLLEPDKCRNWDWYSLNNLPTPLFEPIKILVAQQSIKKLLILPNQEDNACFKTYSKPML